MDCDYANCLNEDLCGKLIEKKWVQLTVNELGIPLIPKNKPAQQNKQALPPIPDLLPPENEENIIPNEESNHNHNRGRKRQRVDDVDDNMDHGLMSKRRRLNDNNREELVVSNRHNSNSNVSYNDRRARSQYRYVWRSP